LRGNAFQTFEGHVFIFKNIDGRPRLIINSGIRRFCSN
jgi:hypothetical protein